MNTKQNNLEINDHVLILDNEDQFYTNLKHKTGIVKNLVTDGHKTYSLVYLDNTNIEVLIDNIYLKIIPDNVFTEWIDYNNLPQFILSYSFNRDDNLMLIIFNHDFNWKIKDFSTIQSKLSKLDSYNPYKHFINNDHCRYEFETLAETDLFYQIAQIGAIIKDHNILLLNTEFCGRYDLIRQMERLMIGQINYAGYINQQGTFLNE